MALQSTNSVQDPSETSSTYIAMCRSFTYSPIIYSRFFKIHCTCIHPHLILQCQNNQYRRCQNQEINRLSIWIYMVLRVTVGGWVDLVRNVDMAFGRKSGSQANVVAVVSNSTRTDCWFHALADGPAVRSGLCSAEKVLDPSAALSRNLPSSEYIVYAWVQVGHHLFTCYCCSGDLWCTHHKAH